jgi:hypothetical protein
LTPQVQVEDPLGVTTSDSTGVAAWLANTVSVLGGEGGSGQFCTTTLTATGVDWGPLLSTVRVAVVAACSQERRWRERWQMGQVSQESLPVVHQHC